MRVDLSQTRPVSQAPGWFGRRLIDAQRTSLLGLHDLSRRLGRRRPQPAHLVAGERGELEALFFLRRRGYVVVARRWRSPNLSGDLDLVAWEGETLCFVEVKTRSERDRTPAALAINEPKRKMLRRMARAYMDTLPRGRDQAEEGRMLSRFDFVSVYLLKTGVECELLQGAFDWRADQSARYGV